MPMSAKSNEPFGAIAVRLGYITPNQVLEALEDKIDLKDALKALKEPGSIGLKEFKRKLGI